jgi:hypothetical protein
LTAAAVALSDGAAFLILAVLLVTLARRRRWAWLVFVVSTGFALLSSTWHWNAIDFGGSLAGLALLASPWIRHHAYPRVDDGSPTTIGTVGHG